MIKLEERKEGKKKNPPDPLSYYTAEHVKQLEVKKTQDTPLKNQHPCYYLTSL